MYPNLYLDLCLVCLTPRTNVLKRLTLQRTIVSLVSLQRTLVSLQRTLVSLQRTLVSLVSLVSISCSGTGAQAVPAATVDAVWASPGHNDVDKLETIRLVFESVSPMAVPDVVGHSIQRRPDLAAQVASRGTCLLCVPLVCANCLCQLFVPIVCASCLCLLFVPLVCASSTTVVLCTVQVD